MDGLTNFVVKKLIPGVLIFMVVGGIISDFVHNPSILIKDFGGTTTLILAVVVIFIIYCFFTRKRIPTPIWILLTVGIIAFIIYSSYIAWLLPYYTVHPILTVCIAEGALVLISIIQFFSMTRKVINANGYVTETIGPLLKLTLTNAKDDLDKLKEECKNDLDKLKEECKNKNSIGLFERLKRKKAIYNKAFDKAFRDLLDMPKPKDKDTALKSRIFNAYWTCHVIFQNIRKSTWAYIFSGKNASGWIFTLFTFFIRLLAAIYWLNIFVVEASCMVILSAIIVVWLPLIGIPAYLLKAAAGKARDRAIHCKYCGRTFSELLEIGDKGIPLYWICTGISKNGREINDCQPIPYERGKSCKCDNDASTCVKTSTFYICEECAEKVDWKKQSKEQDEWRNTGERSEQREERHEEKRTQDSERSQNKERTGEFKTELPRIPIFFDGREASTYSTLANQYVKKTTIGSSMALLRQEDESGEWLMLEVKKSLFSKQQYRLEKYGNIDSHAVWFFFVLMPNELNRQKVTSVLASIRDATIASGILGCTIFLGLDKSVISAYSSEIERLQQAGFGHGERIRKEICTLILDKARLLDEFHNAFKTVNIRPMSGAFKVALEQELQVLQARFKEMEYGQSRN
ncbi:MAG: hypothetical protein IJS08_00465 [Victivallales bacterium]|nr:hypothetical protein [Victivallales bacterium]